MKIGDINYPLALFLAPMAGVTDRAFREICRRYGAEGLTTEMISSKALVFGDEKTAELARISDGERPCALQLFGNEPDIMGNSAVIAAKHFRPCAIDINMGCPAPKIAGNGDGSAIMRTPALAGKIVAAVRESLDREGLSEMPVTVKMRSGFDAEHINAVTVALECERNGAAAITVHGRTREQMYAPPVNLDVIRAVKEAVKIPVIGNGDIYTPEDALRMKEYTHCDGLMIGRASLGNPYVFAKVRAAFGGEPFTEPSAETWLYDVASHMESLIRDKGEERGVREARKHAAWYIRGIPGAADMRRRVNLVKTLAEMESIMKEASERLSLRTDMPNEFKISNLT